MTWNLPKDEDEDFHLMVLLFQARHEVLRAIEIELSKYGFTATQAAVLYIVKAIEGIKEKVTPTKIAKQMLREPHTVSTVLTRMESAGLLNKVKNSTGGRNVHVTLTEKGEQAYSQSLKRESLREVMSCLSKEERKQLASSLKKIRDKAMHRLAVNRHGPPPIDYTNV